MKELLQQQMVNYLTHADERVKKSIILLLTSAVMACIKTGGV